MKTMNLKTASLIGLILLLSVTIPAVYAKGPTKKAGKSNIQQLYLYEKVPSGEWPIVEDGAWGKMKYNLKSGRFVFRGHRLAPNTNYTLINFARNGTEWPASINILGEGKTNRGGNIRIKGIYAYTDLEPDTTPGADDSGAKIWLVLTADLADSTLSGWNPTEYLFEEALIMLPVTP